MSETTDVQTLTGFLLARIAEDEESAREALESEDNVWETYGWWRPSRVLAECEAKRHLLHMMNRFPPDSVASEVAAGMVRVMAAVYADHPDYREEWKP